MKAWQNGAGVYFPITELTNAYGNKVYNESDLVKLRTAYPTYYQNTVEARAAFMPVEGAKGIIQFF